MLNAYLPDARDLIVAKAYAKMPYHAIGIGDQEFINGMDFFYENLYNKLPLISCNLFFHDSTKTVEKYKIIELPNKIKVGITSVNYASGFRYLALTKEISVKDGEILINRALSSLRETVKELRKKSDIVVVMGHLNEEGKVKLLDNCGGYDLFIGGNGGWEFKLPRLIENKIFVQNGTDGEKIGKIDFEMKDNKIVDYSYKLLKVKSKTLKRDKVINDIIKKYENDL